MDTVDKILKQTDNEMKDAIASLDRSLASVRTGRATPALLEGVRVDAYGSMMPLNQVANVMVSEARLLTISPFDKKMIPAIERGIMIADLGLTPNNDGVVVRISLPPLTEERRKELVKQAHVMAEDARIAIRQARKHANDAVKKLEKDKTIAEDSAFGAHDEIQTRTDKYVKSVDTTLESKEKEIMHV